MKKIYQLSLSFLLFTSLLGCQKEEEETLVQNDPKSSSYVEKDVTAEKGQMRPKVDFDSKVEFYSSESFNSKDKTPSTLADKDELVVDIKVVKGRQCMSCWPQNGYTIIPVDLNEGAGGAYIYLVYRKEGGFLGPSIKKGVVAARFKSSSNQFYASSIPDGYAQILDLINPGMQVDLNDGAGGKWIYGFEQFGYGGFSDVGVISGSNSSIQPETGWIRDNTDLNEGAGGKYIYFCYKW